MKWDFIIDSIDFARGIKTPDPSGPIVQWSGYVATQNTLKFRGNEGWDIATAFPDPSKNALIVIWKKALD